MIQWHRRRHARHHTSAQTESDNKSLRTLGPVRQKENPILHILHAVCSIHTVSVYYTYGPVCQHRNAGLSSCPSLEPHLPPLSDSLLLLLFLLYCYIHNSVTASATAQSRMGKCPRDTTLGEKQWDLRALRGGVCRHW
jgi:hypothetical protein